MVINVPVAVAGLVLAHRASAGRWRDRAVQQAGVSCDGAGHRDRPAHRSELGALGGGGSILAVPALVYLLGQSAHQAIAASLLVVGGAAATGAIIHARAERVRLREGAVFGVLGIAGSYAGARLSAAVPASVLLAGFGLLMLAVAATITARRRSQPRAAQDSGRALLARSPQEEGLTPRAVGASYLRGGQHPSLGTAAWPWTGR